MSDAILELKDLKKSYKSDGISLSILPFIVMAVSQLLKQMPDFNSSLDEMVQIWLYSRV